VIRHAPLILSVAVLSWLLPVAMIYPPGALVVGLDASHTLALHMSNYRLIGIRILGIGGTGADGKSCPRLFVVLTFTSAAFRARYDAIRTNDLTPHHTTLPFNYIFSLLTHLS
jgi:hypothetical protein